MFSLSGILYWYNELELDEVGVFEVKMLCYPWTKNVLELFSYAIIDHVWVDQIFFSYILVIGFIIIITPTQY